MAGITSVALPETNPVLDIMSRTTTRTMGYVRISKELKNLSVLLKRPDVNVLTYNTLASFALTCKQSAYEARAIYARREAFHDSKQLWHHFEGLRDASPENLLRYFQ